ncbi:MAG: hypothetical protein U5K76_06045 [Woeseiaceae bacterium]|nr:hypothetical protein [Woeseiaceae bacterium]
MAVLAGIFGGNTEEHSQDSEKLLHLYWNRAELKKEFAGLRKEQYRLRDQVKQQEGATARLQQKLDYLEHLLIDPEWARNVVAFYQLRALAQRCERKLAKFAEQLKQQREQKQHNKLLVQWNDERTHESRLVLQEIAGLQEQILQLEDRLNAERNRLVAMSGFLKIFRRRSVAAILESVEQEIETARVQELEWTDKLEQIKNRKPPENRGLDIPTKRSINFMIIAYAQQLYLHFGDSDFAALAKEANDKSVGAVRYGSANDCEHLLSRVQRRVERMERASNSAADLQNRAQLIGKKAVFRQDDEAVPVATSVSTVFEFDSKGGISESKADLLGRELWGLAKYLSR